MTTKAKITDLYYEEYQVGEWPKATVAVRVQVYSVKDASSSYEHSVIDLMTPDSFQLVASTNADSDVIREAIRMFDEAVAALTQESEPGEAA